MSSADVERDTKLMSTSVHQDLKPENIWVSTANEKPYPACDFKIANLALSQFWNDGANFEDPDLERKAVILDFKSHGTYTYSRFLAYVWSMDCSHSMQEHLRFIGLISR